MSHTLTPAIRARLAEFAAAITPPAGGPPTTSLTPAAIKAGGLAQMVHRAGSMPAVNHGRRLQTAYVAGGWPRVEEYLQPFLTPAGYARQLAANAAAVLAAGGGTPLAPGAVVPGIIGQSAGDFGPLPPIDEQQPNALRVCEPLVPVVALATAGVPGYENALATGAPAEHVWLDEAGHVHRPGTLPGGPSCEPRLPYDAGAATRRLQLAYEAGVAEPGDIYRAHQEVQEAPRGLCMSDNAGSCLACLQGGPGCITADFVPRFSCDCGRQLASSAAPAPAGDCGPCRGECAICEQAA